MKTPHVAAILSSWVFLAVGCETPKSVDPSTSTAEKAPPETTRAAALSEAQIARLIERAEKARDRPLQTRPSFVAVERLDEPTGPQPAAGELLGRTLFDFGDAREHVDPRPPYARIARFEPDANRIVYAPGTHDQQQVSVALIAALVSAIDAQNFEAPPAASSWDEALTQAVVREATVLFSLASDLLAQHHPDISIDLLARRPELVTNLPYLGDWMAYEPASSAATSEQPGVLSQRIQRFVTRQAWQLAAALYRSNGWSGVELAGAMRPAQTADIVRPDQWMRGAPVGQWTWPEEVADARNKPDAPRPHRGSVGPALISIWLEDVVDARLTQSLFAGYLSDAYRYYEDGSKPASARFEWLLLWDSPSSASQVAAAFEQRLRARFGAHDGAQSTGRFSVSVEGLTVGVIIEAGADSQERRQARRARATHLLKQHSVDLMPRTPLPTTFVPTRRDALAASTSALNERVWQDSAANLRMDLTPLGQQWRVQRPDAGTLRWFASHPDGALLQLSVELDNPLGPDFESTQYREKIRDAFTQSLDEPTVEFLRGNDAKLSGALDDPGLVLRLRGRLNQQHRSLQLWQFHRGDLLVTYSLQAPPESFLAHLEKATAILASSARVQSKSQRDADIGEDTERHTAEPAGRIEYQVED